MQAAAPSSRIAVIAVHGVADQRPTDSVRAIAAHLLDRASAEYEPFVERTIHIPLKPLTDDRSAAAAASSTTGETAGPTRKGVFEELEPDYAVALGVDSPQKDLAKPRPVNVDHAFMRSLLRGYKHRTEPTAYTTARLESTRSAGGVSQSVHVYELYWADLSTLSRDPLRFFAALYQLVLHVCELGRQALFDAYPEFGGETQWRHLAWCQKWAVRILTLFIPLLNVVLLIAVLTAAVVRVAAGSLLEASIHLPEDRGLKFFTVAATTAIAVCIAYSVASRSPKPGEEGWARIPLLAIALGVVVGFALVDGTHRADVVLAFEWWVVAFAILKAIVTRYERFRPGARRVAFVTYGVAFAAFSLALITALAMSPMPGREVEHAAIWTMQMLLFPLSGFWIAFVILGLAAFYFGSRAFRKQEGLARCRAEAAVRTSRLSLAISASAMILIVTIVWSALVAWTVRSLHVFECMETSVFPLFGSMTFVSSPESIQSWAPPLKPDPACPGLKLPVHHYFTALVALSTTSGLPFTLGVIGLALLLLTWMALPSAVLEGTRGPQSDLDSARQGRWLSLGLHAMRRVEHVWFIAVFLILLVFGLGDFLTRRPDVPGWLGLQMWYPLHRFFSWSAGVTVPMISAGGGLVATSAAVIVFTLAKLGGSALDVMLDVDNYLRDKPSEAPPRARIAERYVSLLRYVGGQTDENGKRYDKIVIIAHSLGALITVDLLRFLSLESHAGRGDLNLRPFGYGPRGGDAQIPITLFTMGNPLRQLLNRFFPHLYRWVCDQPEGCERPVESAIPPVIPAPCAPSPSELGVAAWVNAYRSGDYVGRSLWTSEWHCRRFSRIPAAPAGKYVVDIKRDGNVAELCIGAGAHTHYWDSAAPEIADVLDQLIAREASSLTIATGVTSA